MPVVGTRERPFQVDPTPTPRLDALAELSSYLVEVVHPLAWIQRQYYKAKERGDKELCAHWVTQYAKVMRKGQEMRSRMMTLSK